MRYLIFSDARNQESVDLLARAAEYFFRDETVYLGKTSLKLPESVFQASNQPPFNNKELVAYDTSLGKSSGTLDEITQEFETLQSRYPNCRYFASRATPQKGVCVFNPHKKATRYSFPDSELKSSEICLINPGSLSGEQSFAILDTNQSKARLYTLEEAEEVAENKFLLDYFAEEIIKYLTGEKNGVNTLRLSGNASYLEQYNRKGKLDKILKLMMQFNPVRNRVPRNMKLERSLREQNQAYYQDKSLELAREFQKLVTPEFSFAYGMDENYLTPVDYWKYRFG